MAWRSSGIPIMGGYWFQPSTTASAALRRTSSGPGSSGKPCPRFTAPVSPARRDITSKTEVGTSAKIGFMRSFSHLRPHLLREGVDGVRGGGAAADRQARPHVEPPPRRHGGEQGRVPHER